MSLSEIPKFDPDLFTSTELSELDVLVGFCVEAVTADEINAAGEVLDATRAERRLETRKNAAVDRSLNALFKALLKEVPRGTNVEGKMVARPERLAT